jgi:hypothetical protein
MPKFARYSPEDGAMHQLETEMQHCVDLCEACAKTCFTTAMNHCLEVGGKHVEPQHFKLMIACAEICRASAVVMTTGIEQHVFVCSACEKICTACADSCEAIGDMQECVDACRQCAKSCRTMSHEKRAA